MTSAPRSLRTGFSLLEILLATSMLVIAITALSHLSSVGRQHLSGASKRTVAVRLAANKMARLAAGIEPLEEHQTQPLSEDPDWECALELRPVADGELVEVRVGVRPLADAQAFAGDPAIAGREKPWFYVARWMAPHAVPRRSAPSAPSSSPPSSSSASSSSANSQAASDAIRGRRRP